MLQGKSILLFPAFSTVGRTETQAVLCLPGTSFLTKYTMCTVHSAKSFENNLNRPLYNYCLEVLLSSKIFPGKQGITVQVGWKVELLVYR